MKTQHIEPVFRSLVDKVLRFMKENDQTADRLLSGEEFEIGRGSHDASFNAPGHALDYPVFVGDLAPGVADASAEVRALFDQDPSKVLRIPRWNRAKNAYELLFRKADRMAVSDAAPDLITAQLLAAPGLVAWFEQLFRRPLLYFRARDMVKIYQGNSPWAPVMSLPTVNYSGGAQVAAAGSPENISNADVNAEVRLMTQAVIDITGSYSLSVEELERAKGTTMPYGSQTIDDKRAFVDYAIELIFNALIYFGNPDSETQGIFDVASIEDYSGPSAEHISLDSTDASKGSHIYQALASRISNFLTRSGNKFNKLRIAVSPGYWNLLGWVPYSDVYEADAPRVQLLKNFIAGGDKGSPHDVDFDIIHDPLLGPSGDGVTNLINPFNNHEFDYTVITAPEIKAGPTEVSQGGVIAGVPLDKFVYPTIPGQYMTNYKILKRYGGVYSPVKDAVMVIQGLGFQPSDT